MAFHIVKKNIKCQIYRGNLFANEKSKPSQQCFQSIQDIYEQGWKQF